MKNLRARIQKDLRKRASSSKVQTNTTTTIAMKISIILGSTRIGRNSQRVSLALTKELENRGVEAHHIDVKDWPVHQFEERGSKFPMPPTCSRRWRMNSRPPMP